MGYSKRQFIDAALAEIGLANFAFDMGPEQVQWVLARLDAMMAEWNARGARLGYPLPSSPPSSDLDDETGVPDSAWEAIICNLAVRIAPGFGRTPMPETKARARSGCNTVLLASATPPERQYPGTLAAGAGNKPWRRDQPFMPPPRDPLEAGPDGPLEFT